MPRSVYKLVPEVINRLLGGLEKGLTMNLACGYAGITRNTFYIWRKNAEKDEQEGVVSEYTKFMSQYREARAQRAMKWLGSIERAGELHWQANAWLLERTEREHYGQNITITDDVSSDSEDSTSDSNNSLDDRIKRVLDTLNTARERAANPGFSGDRDTEPEAN